jgi:ABC-type transport system substrate-binding protein
MVWRLKHPYSPMLGRIHSDKFAYVLQPKELNANPSLAERTAIGTGYKILDRHQAAIGIEYRKNPDYWGGDPFIERWHAPIIPEYANRYAQFVNGNITDFTPTAKDVLLLAKDAPNTVIVGNEPSEEDVTRMRFGRVNPERYPWADPRVRVAIRRSIDFKGIGEFLSNKAEFERNGIAIDVTPMTHLPHNPGYWLNPEKGELGKLSDNYLHGPEDARKLLAAAGHTAPLELPFYIEVARGQDSEIDQLMIDSMNQSGAISPQVYRSTSSTEFRNYRTFGQMPTGGLASLSGSSNEVDYIVYLDYSNTPGLIYPLPYPDARSDALAESQRRETDVAKRFEILRGFQHLQAELMMTIPGEHLFTQFNFRWPWLHNSNYGGTGSPPTGRPVSGGHLHWLDKDMPDRDKRI